MKKLNLFEDNNNQEQAPLASRMRPLELDEIVGQQHIIGKDRLLYRAIKADRIESIILYGPPGTGKTTIAKVIANTTDSCFCKLNATNAGIKDVEKVIEEAQFNYGAYQKKTILFIDEIHRFNKTQQDYLLPFVEGGVVTLIGATTENPYFEVNNALLSRCRIFELKPLEKNDLIELINRTLSDKTRGLGKANIVIDDEAKEFLADMANGDARSVLNALELAYLTTEPTKEGILHITLPVAEECIQKKAIRYDEHGDNHYDAISAFIESMKHTEPDATLYYLARMLVAGEDIKYIARRICVCASEDVGLANSRALEVATSAMLAVERIGMPESAKILAHAALYVCCSPKSDSAYGIIEAMKDVEETGNIPIPPFLQDASYKNAYKLGRGVGLDNIHSFPNHYSGKNCMPEALKDKHYFKLSGTGNEKKIQEFLKYLKEHVK
ncbi:MAG TPA: replication-associated recombination protein A [Candidatus Scybalousia intestinigallinarum]|nr:replication-associated recombination protein A [Candidatus Scybalousia intestinigallinarum]